MVRIEDSVVARYEAKGHRLEILIDPKLIDLLKSGKQVNIVDYMVIDEVFKDARKGDKVGEEVLKEVFGTTDINEVARQIVLKGQVQLTTDQRRKMLEEKKRQIVNEIAKNAINPQTNAPHPPQRIEKAIEEAKVHIDPMKSVEEQIPIVLKAIKAIIPIRIEKIKMEIKVGADGYGKIYQDLVRMGTLVKEEWGNDGSWKAIVEIPAGMQAEFLDMLNKKTHGNIETKIVKG
ncbi:MAG: ribosome assembly factor SBDS [Thermoplasmata archaeon]|jgi:ribosome maturation protein SDO1|nr:ribosome assembly factor SBDS [Thermoplasmatales archaeon]PMP75081.1 MAG: ribosome assembly factor SBDS [Aciduliprofundum sp.]HEU12946.1 ribosome assembly factor SBDS [Euryarchaeota archaeon]